MVILVSGKPAVTMDFINDFIYIPSFIYVVCNDMIKNVMM
ncbi:protein of unknown function [Moritella yayanosii]|uniref:Uncharacterized protein n=1 Tax=Moritella yayanosii TaxID=69539 RepID=A0A330LQ22_9GAMM|nr:protein of unknown function [Moritella yayanosii]